MFQNIPIWIPLIICALASLLSFLALNKYVKLIFGALSCTLGVSVFLARPHVIEYFQKEKPQDQNPPLVELLQKECDEKSAKIAELLAQLDKNEDSIHPLVKGLKEQSQEKSVEIERLLEEIQSQKLRHIEELNQTKLEIAQLKGLVESEKAENLTLRAVLAKQAGMEMELAQAKKELALATSELEEAKKKEVEISKKPSIPKIRLPKEEDETQTEQVNPDPVSPKKGSKPKISEPEGDEPDSFTTRLQWAASYTLEVPIGGKIYKISLDTLPPKYWFDRDTTIKRGLLESRDRLAEKLVKEYLVKGKEIPPQWKHPEE